MAGDTDPNTSTDNKKVHRQPRAGIKFEALFLLSFLIK